MKPVYMTRTHKPPDSYGDCLRCCIASILETEPEYVPHPFEFGPEDSEHYEFFVKSLKDKFGVWLAVMSIHACDLQLHLANMSGYAILSGRSPRSAHTVVVDNTGIVHNPNPLNDGIAPHETNNYQLIFLCRGVK